MTAKDTGNDNISLPKIATSQIEEQRVGVEITKELYMPLSSTIVPKSKKEMLYVPLHFRNGLTTGVFVESRAYVSANAQSEMDSNKQKAHANRFKIDDPPNFQIQIGNGQLEKPIATTLPKFDSGDNTFAEHFVLTRILTGPSLGLRIVSYITVVIDT